MKAIVYLSKANNTFSSLDLAKLSDCSCYRNEQYGITGYVLFYQGYFLQYIEGNETQINQLYLNIDRDSRHNVLVKFEQAELEDRRFSDWKMKFISSMDIKRICPESILRKLIEQARKASYQAKDFWEIVSGIYQDYQQNRVR